MHRRAFRLSLLVGLAVLVSGAALLWRRTPERAASGGAFAVSQRTIRVGDSVVPAWLPITGDTGRRWPLLLFSPGLSQAPLDYSLLARDMASHGYVVVGIAHPDALPSAYPDMAVTIARDLVAALDSLATSTDRGAFPRLDFDKVGVFGHSMGGAAAAIACRLDRRFKAGIDFDGSVFGEAVTEGVPAPFLLFTADLGVTDFELDEPLPFDPAPDRGRLHEELLFSRSPIAYWATVSGLRHTAFADQGAMHPLERFGTLVGRFATGPETRALAVGYATVFFDRFVAGTGDTTHALALPRSSRVSVAFHWRAPP